MQIRAVLLTALALLSAGGLTARADDKKDIKAVYVKVVNAMKAKDLKAVFATGTQDFSYTENGKTMSGDELSNMMQQQFQMIKGTPKVKMNVVSCKITGAMAEVVSTDASEMMISGEDGKTHKLVSTGKSKDELVKTDKGWLMKSVTILSSAMTLDGKPYDPSKAMAAPKQ